MEDYSLFSWEFIALDWFLFDRASVAQTWFQTGLSEGGEVCVIPKNGVNARVPECFHVVYSRKAPAEEEPGFKGQLNVLGEV